MPIQRTYQQSDIEKRLKLLKYQLYGKRLEVAPIVKESSPNDLLYLKHDLKKITLLATLAVTAELILYFSQLPNKIKLF